MITMRGVAILALGRWDFTSINEAAGDPTNRAVQRAPAITVVLGKPA
jgi:hypothetical protein